MSFPRTNDNTPNDDNRFINRKDNNSFPTTCGLTLTLLLDRSGSIAPNAGTYQAAANTFVDSLAGTPTILSIDSFAASASSAANNPYDLSINPGTGTTGVNGAKAAIASIYSSPSGGTNWDQGLRQTIPPTSTASQVTIILTDGNPTTNDTSLNGGGGTITLNDLQTGIASANSVKATGTKLIAVGAGTGVTAANLEAISGPGDFFTSSIADLANTLKAIANQLCGSRIHVKKLVNDVATDGWNFDGAATGATVSYPNGHTTGSTVTGEMQINLDNVPASPTGATNVSVNETDLAGHPGFSLQGSKCVKSSTTAYPTQAEAIAAGATNPRPIGTVQRNEDWWCTYVNQLNKADTTTVTAIHNDANHNVIPNGSSVPSGTTVHDSATVSGGLTTPTGTVTFTFFTNGTCDGAGQAAGVVALTGGVADPSTAFGPLAAGSYSFRATYNGDTTHNASPPSGCEPFSVDKANTTTVTAIHNDANHNVIPNGSSVPSGTTVHDSATVSGGPTTPTGTVTFTFFTNGTCDGAGRAREPSH